MDGPSYVISTKFGAIPHVIDASIARCFEKDVKVYVDDFLYKDSVYDKGLQMGIAEFCNIGTKIYVAFRGSLSMLFGRVLIAVVTAAAVAVVVKRSQQLLLLNGRDSEHHSHEDHDHDHHQHHDRQMTPKTKLLAVLRHAGYDFLDMGKFLILGAFAAAFFKTFF